MKSLVMIGYKGPGSKQVATVNNKWRAQTTNSDLYKEVQKLDNYDPNKIWGNKGSDIVVSNYDTDNCVKTSRREATIRRRPTQLWLPHFYNYSVRGEGRAVRPRAIATPGDKIRLKFKNKIALTI